MSRDKSLIWHNLPESHLSDLRSVFEEATNKTFEWNQLVQSLNIETVKSPEWILVQNKEVTGAELQKLSRHAPVLVIFDELTSREAANLIQDGAHELIWSNDFYVEILKKRLDQARRQYKEKSKEEKHHRQSSESDHTDHETGLLGRVIFLDQLRTKVQQSYETENPLSLAVLKIEGLSNFLSDKALEVSLPLLGTIGSVITSKLDQEEIAGRFSVNQFVLGLPDIDLDLSKTRIKRITQDIKRRIQQSDTTESVQFGYNVGLAETDPISIVDQPKKSVDDLIHDAQRALNRNDPANKGGVNLERRRYPREDIESVPVKVFLEDQEVDAEINEYSVGMVDGNQVIVGLRMRSDQLISSGQEITVSVDREDWQEELFKSAEGVVRWSHHDESADTAFMGVSLWETNF